MIVCAWRWQVELEVLKWLVMVKEEALLSCALVVLRGTYVWPWEASGVVKVSSPSPLHLTTKLPTPTSQQPTESHPPKYNLRRTRKANAGFRDFVAGSIRPRESGVELQEEDVWLPDPPPRPKRRRVAEESDANASPAPLHRDEDNTAETKGSMHYAASRPNNDVDKMAEARHSLTPQTYKIVGYRHRSLIPGWWRMSTKAREAKGGTSTKAREPSPQTPRQSGTWGTKSAEEVKGGEAPAQAGTQVVDNTEAKGNQSPLHASTLCTESQEEAKGSEASLETTEEAKGSEASMGSNEPKGSEAFMETTGESKRSGAPMETTGKARDSEASMETTKEAKGTRASIEDHREGEGHGDYREGEGQ